MAFTFVINTQTIMWPFKKKKNNTETTPPGFSSILCIPGNWDSHKDFILSMVGSSNGEFIAAGMVIINSKQQWHCTFEFCERDERMKQSFQSAGKVTGVSEVFLEEIESHKSNVYLTAVSGDLDAAERLARIGAAVVLQAGGIGIKVETAGKAFMKDQWLELLHDFQQSNLYQMFVIDSIIDEEGTVFSCGMQNLGYKDTIVSGEEFQHAVDLVKLFGYFQVIDKPVIKHNETFSPTADSEIYRITEELNPPYKDHEQFGNPFGMWRLTRIER